MITCEKKLLLASLTVLFVSTQAPRTVEAQQPAPAPAPAEGGGDPRPSFEEGRAQMQAQRFAEAAKKFEQSVAIRPTIGALLNLGDCYEKVGRYASAVRAFEQAKDLSATSRDKTREQEAETRAAPLRSALSTLTVRAQNKTEGMAISLDGTDVAIDRPLPVDGGDHMVKASARCHKPHEMHVTVGLRSDAREVMIPSLAPSTDEPGCGPATTATTPVVTTTQEPAATTATTPGDTAGGSTWTTQKTIGVAVGAVGIVGVGVGSFFGLSAIGTKGDLKDRCSSYPNGCPFEQKDDLDKMHSDGETAAMISTIAFIAGAALIAGGAVLFFTASDKRTGSTGSTATALSSSRRALLTF